MAAVTLLGPHPAPGELVLTTQSKVRLQGYSSPFASPCTRGPSRLFARWRAGRTKPTLRYAGESQMDGRRSGAVCYRLNDYVSLLWRIFRTSGADWLAAQARR